MALLNSSVVLCIVGNNKILKHAFASGKLALGWKNSTQIFLLRPVGGTWRCVVVNFSKIFKTGTSPPSAGICSEERKDEYYYVWIPTWQQFRIYEKLKATCAIASLSNVNRCYFMHIFLSMSYPTNTVADQFRMVCRVSHVTTWGTMF